MEAAAGARASLRGRAVQLATPVKDQPSSWLAAVRRSLEAIKHIESPRVTFLLGGLQSKDSAVIGASAIQCCSIEVSVRVENYGRFNVQSAAGTVEAV